MKKLLFAISVIWVSVSCSPSFTKYEETAKSWEPEIQRLEARDKTEKHREDAILFVGSSSIRLWDNIENDMAPYFVIQRGYGGAKLSDLIFYTDRLVYPHNFRALVVFVANDITGGADDKSPQEVLKLYKEVIRVVREKYPTKPIFFVEITPTNSRWKVWPQIQQANSLIKGYCSPSKNLYFIETANAFLNEKGTPNNELFVQDQLHLKQQGYDIWASLIKQQLRQVLGDIY